MKKIINGKLYDTQTAREIGGMDHIADIRSAEHWSETLYRKRTGEYFLYGEGGPLTKYAVNNGNNSWGFGETIIPLSEDSAREWAEKNLDADRYAAAFGEVSEGDAKTDNVLIKFPAKTGEKLRAIAQAQGKSMTALLTELVDRL